MSAILNVIGREILDSRGNPTVEAEVYLESGAMGRAAVPSGASTGRHEAVELRDDDQNRYAGKGTLKAVEAINTTIAEKITGFDALEQRFIDQRLKDADGSEDKSRLGANAILAVSLATAKAAAQHLGLPLYRYIGGPQARQLPMPMMNIINGGAHGDNAIDIQEFMIVPLSATCFSEALRMGVDVFHMLRTLLQKAGFNTNVGDEGGFAPNLTSTTQALDYILEAIRKAGYKPGSDIALALDVAATELYKDNAYHLSGENKIMSSTEMTLYCQKLISGYPIVSIEDALAEDDFEGWAYMTKQVGYKTQLVGDDLFVTNTQRLQTGLDRQMTNAILIKPNQVGTLSETLDTIETAQQHQMATIMSHRSGETEDTTIADLAVAMNCGQIKTGAPSRTDRIAKYNQLLRIEEALGKQAVFKNPFI